MEVHHHSHTSDPDSHRGRKKWAHYFWEFLMLFLAVFCGFLAENQREHLVERNRAKEYAKSLLSDLRLDTSELRRGTQQARVVIAAIDSLASISSNMDTKNGFPGSFYSYSNFVFPSFQVDWARSTTDQLIQSGNLRYFKNKKLVEMINSYYYMEGIISRQNRLDAEERDKTIEIRNSILLSKYYALFAQQPSASGNVLFQTNDSINNQLFPVQENAEKLVDKYINHLLDRKARLVNIADAYYPVANDLGLGIIQTLIKEYHLE